MPTRRVSIHAFRGEGDITSAVDCTPPPYVSIHAFRGEGDVIRDQLQLRAWVSIHAFRGEGDHNAVHQPVDSAWFQSTPSGGKATRRVRSHPPATRFCFNPRLPGGRRLKRYPQLVEMARFQSTPSGGKATGRA